MADYVQILTTAESREDAYALAQSLISGRHAVSVQIAGPVVTIFMQDSALVEAHQWQLAIRTTAVHVSTIREMVTASEFVVVPILDGNVDGTESISDLLR